MLQNAFGLIYEQTFIQSPRLTLRFLHENDRTAWLKLKQENYDFLQPFEPIWDMDALTYIGFNRMLEDTKAAFERCQYYNFAIVEKETGRIVGGIEIANILGWPKQSATIGYWMSETEQGKGYMSEAVQSVCKWTIQKLNLIKIEAGTMTHNVKSQRVLTKAGFKQEGISKAYGEIDGTYTDHVLWGATVNDLQKNTLSLQ